MKQALWFILSTIIIITHLVYSALIMHTYNWDYFLYDIKWGELNQSKSEMGNTNKKFEGIPFTFSKE